MILLAGNSALYRDVHVGDAGSDVDAVRASLVRLGLLSGKAALAKSFDGDMADAVSKLYRKCGYSVPMQHVQPEAPAAPYDQVYLPRIELHMRSSAPAVVTSVNAAVDRGDATLPSATDVVVGLGATTLEAVIDQPSGTTEIPVGSKVSINPPVIANEAPGDPVGGAVLAAVEQSSGNGPPATKLHVQLERSVLGWLNQPVVGTFIFGSTTEAVPSLPTAAIDMADDGTATVTIDGKSKSVKIGESLGGYVQVDLPIGTVVHYG